MRQRVTWLTFWITMTYWLGSAFGCASSSSVQHPETATQTLSAPQVIEVVQADAQPSEAAPDAAPAAANQDDVVSTRVGRYDVNTKATVRDEYGLTSVATPSLRGNDRSHWSEVSLHGEDGRTTHFPLYFSDPRASYDEPAAAEPMSVEAAMQGERPQNYSGANVFDAVVAPGKFLFDIAALPVRAVLSPPWSRVTTPPTPAETSDAD